MNLTVLLVMQTAEKQFHEVFYDYNVTTVIKISYEGIMEAYDKTVSEKLGKAALE